MSFASASAFVAAAFSLLRGQLWVTYRDAARDRRAHGKAPGHLTLPPRRVAQARVAKGRFPKEYALLLPALELADPLADQAIASLEGLPRADAHELTRLAISNERVRDRCVPDALLRLVDDARTVPDWVDWTRLDRAGRVFFRAGLLGGIVLSMRSLVYGYASPVGNKPLAFTGALEEKSERRLAETSRFVSSVSRPGMMHPGRGGFSDTLFVRLMHAKVRSLALADPRWEGTSWGVPINQHDMVATILLFSVVFIEGIEQLGVHVTSEEKEDFQYLWRWVGVVMGVEAKLLPTSYAQAQNMAAFIRFTQGEPDDDSRALVSALLHQPLKRATTPRQVRRAKRLVEAAEGICRSLIDDRTADALGVRRGFTTAAVPKVRATFRVLEALRRRLQALDPFVESLGQRYWSLNVGHGLREGGDVFRLPVRLRGRRASP